MPTWVDELVERIEAEREVVGRQTVPSGHAFAGEQYGGSTDIQVAITAPATAAAAQWAGWGTALKPAMEPITVARKPLVGTVAENVLQHGTGAINVDGCRVKFGSNDEAEAHAKQWDRTWTTSPIHKWDEAIGNHPGPKRENGTGPNHVSGRWPANLIHDGSDEVVAGFP